MSKGSMRQLWILIALFSSNSFATSAACPKDSEGYFPSEGVTVEWHSAGEIQKFANIFLPAQYKSRDLFQVEFQAGDWKYNDNDREEEAPLLSGQLQVREFKGKSMVQLFTTANTPKITLFIRYGDLCGYTMLYEHTHNKSSKKDALTRASS
jgi:hypothetical protein